MRHVAYSPPSFCPHCSAILPARTPGRLAAYFKSGEAGSDLSHTDWVDARVRQTAFTITFVPNTKVLYSIGGASCDADFNSHRNGRPMTLPTYTAVTRRSYHAGVANVLLMDGLVRFTGSSISQSVWRALGTRARGEVVGGEF